MSWCLLRDTRPLAHARNPLLNFAEEKMTCVWCVQVLLHMQCHLSLCGSSRVEMRMREARTLSMGTAGVVTKGQCIADYCLWHSRAAKLQLILAVCRAWQKLRAGGLRTRQSRRTGQPSIAASALTRPHWMRSMCAPWPPLRRSSQRQQLVRPWPLRCAKEGLKRAHPSGAAQAHQCS